MFAAESSGQAKLGFPKSLDWSPDKVTPVKNQGPKFSTACYSFPPLEAMESRVHIAGGELVELSEQEIIDCDKVFK